MTDLRAQLFAIDSEFSDLLNSEVDGKQKAKASVGFQQRLMRIQPEVKLSGDPKMIDYFLSVAKRLLKDGFGVE